MKQTVIILSPFWSGVVLGGVAVFVIGFFIAWCRAINQTFKDYGDKK